MTANIILPNGKRITIDEWEMLTTRQQGAYLRHERFPFTTETKMKISASLKKSYQDKETKK